MSRARGWLRKMKITLDEGGYAHYGMVFKGQDVIPMDDWVGRHIQLEFLCYSLCSMIVLPKIIQSRLLLPMLAISCSL